MMIKKRISVLFVLLFTVCFASSFAVTAHADWREDSGVWYYDGTTGDAYTGWHNDIPGWENKWFYFDIASGVMATGWRTIDGNMYYFLSDGTMQTGEVTIGDATYLFGNDGAYIRTVSGMTPGQDANTETGSVISDGSIPLIVILAEALVIVGLVVYIVKLKRGKAGAGASAS